MTTPTVVDLFSGCGGGSRGFLDAGFRVVGAVEILDEPACSYRGLIGREPVVADICAVEGAELVEGMAAAEELTLLFGCPPCQSFTILRRGSAEVALDAIRNALPAQYLRLVDEIRPRHIAFENVPGLVEGRWRPAFDEFIERLADLGYQTCWAVVDAADFGVPQRRRRVLLMGSRVTTPRLPQPTHGSKSNSGLPHVTVADVLSDLPELASGEADPDDPMHRARRHRALAVERLQHVPEGGGRLDLPERLQLRCHDGHDGHYDIYGRMRWDRPSPTLTSGCTNVTRGRFGHPVQDRAITAREALLLQSFTADVVLVGGTESVALQIGNAVPPLFARRIGDAVLGVEEAAQARQSRRA
jgi:DNA (cytosine-5)-methyltransferase 1